jgi:peptide deformylase
VGKGGAMKIAEMLVQNGEKDDDVLHMKSGPVNMRLYRENKSYRKLIVSIVDYMLMGSAFNFEDYPKARGISGANVGIPLNIVIVIGRHKLGPQVFLNPVITKESQDSVTAKSNCGSLNLDESITVVRRQWVWIDYYNLDGNKRSGKYEIGDNGIVSSATLQHEIDHNLGILITEREDSNDD